MSDKEYIDFKKEFKDFAQDLENSKPIFDDGDLSFDDFDNLVGNIGENDLSDDSIDRYGSIHDDLDKLDSLFGSDCPEITLETEDMLMNLSIKKDYSKIEDLDLRKKEFFKDLKAFIDEFESTEESDELMKFYDD